MPNITPCVYVQLGYFILHMKSMPEILPLISCIVTSLTLQPAVAVSGMNAFVSKWDLFGVLCAQQVDPSPDVYVMSLIV